VVDVDYRGSTGYGRPFRDLLKYKWGVYDVQDAEKAALYLVKEGKVDVNRICISGGSAGGFTTLAALANTSAFSAGCSLYGVADLTKLAEDTHKFESHYLDQLIGPYPEQKALYIDRSPITHVDRLKSPLYIFQGDEDKIVPLNQAQAIFDAVNAKKIPVGIEIFKGEQHGFRKAENIKRSLDAQISFYCKVYGIPSQFVVPIDLKNEENIKPLKK